MAERKRTIDPIRLSSARSAEELLDALLSFFPERSGIIARERFGILDGIEKTLEEIGRAHNITRERVRQIVDVILKRAKEILKREAGHVLIGRVIDTVKDRGGIMTMNDLVEILSDGTTAERKALAALLPTFPGTKIGKETAKRKMVIMAEDFDLPNWEKQITILVRLLQGTNEVQSLENLYALFMKESGCADLTKEIFESLLTPSIEIEKNAFGRYGLSHWSAVRPRGTRERAHLILQVIKKPLHFREIARLIDEHGLYKSGKKTHPQTVHNELIKDKRFVLVGRGTYALSDWGFRPGTVREVLKSILKEHDKPMTRDDLLKAVMKARQVKRSTVIINLNSFFTKVGKNIYSLTDDKS